MSGFEEALWANHRPVSVVLAVSGQVFGLMVDAVDSVVRLELREDDRMEEQGLACASDLLRRLVLRGRQGGAGVLAGS